MPSSIGGSGQQTSKIMNDPNAILILFIFQTIAFKDSLISTDFTTTILRPAEPSYGWHARHTQEKSVIGTDAPMTRIRFLIIIESGLFPFRAR